jgi:two-component system, sensor histidine kinase YesM
MRRTSTRRKFFKKEIRKTFFVYALIPTILLSFLFYNILLAYSSRLIRERNDENNKAVSETLDSEIQLYRNEIGKISESAAIRNIFRDGSGKTPLYEILYRFANERVIKTYFNIIDINGKVLITNSWGNTRDSSRNLTETGMLRKLTGNPDEISIIVNRADLKYSTSKVLSIGKALIDENSHITGFFLFDLYEDDIKTALQWNMGDLLVITDSFNNAIISSNNAVVDIMEKFSPIEYESRYTMIGKTRFFVNKRAVADGNIIVNSLSSMAFIDRLYTTGMAMMAGIFLIMGTCIFFISRRFAESKGKSLDELLNAIKKVQEGNLDTFVDIKTNDEFEMLGSYYNEMIIKLKELIRLNFEQTRQNKISELQQLEAQFNPHFLFNTLEMIRYLITEDPQAASKTIVNMAHLLRYSIDYEKENVVLEDDIQYIENYLHIQKMRFNNRFDYEILIDDDAIRCMVPKLIIQPLIENSIKYGFEGKEYLRITLTGIIRDNKLILKAIDNGAGIDSGKLDEIRSLLKQERNTSTHIGLYNVNKRISLLYGGGYPIHISSAVCKGTEITVELPASIISIRENFSVRGIV